MDQFQSFCLFFVHFASQFNYKFSNLGFEPGAKELKAQTDPVSYGGRPNHWPILWMLCHNKFTWSSKLNFIFEIYFMQKHFIGSGRALQKGSRLAYVSVTWLGSFWKFLVTNFPAKVAQIQRRLLGNFEHINFEVKPGMATFWAIFGKIALIFVSASSYTGLSGNIFDCDCRIVTFLLDIFWMGKIGVFILWSENIPLMELPTDVRLLYVYWMILRQTKDSEKSSDSWFLNIHATSKGTSSFKPSTNVRPVV